MKREILELALQLQENPKLEQPLAESFKIRLAVSSKGKGESGGVRIITHFWAIQSTIYLISIYDKSE